MLYSSVRSANSYGKLIMMYCYKQYGVVRDSLNCPTLPESTLCRLQSWPSVGPVDWRGLAVIGQSLGVLVRPTLWGQMSRDTPTFSGHFRRCQDICLSSQSWPHSDSQTRVLIPTTHCPHTPWHTCGPDLSGPTNRHKIAHSSVRLLRVWNASCWSFSLEAPPTCASAATV